jgi:hypothetical protein
MKKPAKKRKTPPKPKIRPGRDSVEPVRVVRCEATMDGDRSIECESGPEYFCFEFRTGKHTQRLKITNEAAWIVREMLDALHPNICGSNNPMWHKVQAMRKGDETMKPELDTNNTPGAVAQE